MKTRTKTFSRLFAMVIMLMLLSSCSEKTQSVPGESNTSTQKQPTTSEQSPTNTSNGDTNKELEHAAALVADMSFGSGNDDLISRYEYGYDGLLTVKMMAQGLSELTGLNFAINDSASGSGGVRVDWSSDAIFIAGLGETPQKDAFFMYDSESLTWFMLDSMYRTILENNGGNLEIYYSMDGWNPLMNEVFASQGGFPVDMPYTGNHTGRGDIFDDDLGSDSEGGYDGGLAY